MDISDAMWGSNIAWHEEPFDTVLSEDIWKKFELEPPRLMEPHFSYGSVYEDMTIYGQNSEMEHLKVSVIIPNHDCMWSGICINKQHNKKLPTKNDSQMHPKVAAGRSLLISNATSISSSQLYNRNKQQNCKRKDNLESDGDSVRSDTPQTSSESEMECECDILMFKHHQMKVSDKLPEYLSLMKALPATLVTGQYVEEYEKKKPKSCDKQDHCTVSKRTRNSIKITREEEIRNTTMTDHCYYINQPNIKRLEDLGVQTPSDSEEEIDVVSFDKSARPAALSTHPHCVNRQTFHLTVNTAFKEKPAPRPRGRPPLNANRKRAATADQRPAKRVATQRAYQKKTKTTKNTPLSQSIPVSIPLAVPIAPPVKSVSSSRSSSDDEIDNDRRNLHNNMERQRRIELRNAFDNLRLLVPEIEAKEKAPKVAILRQAAKYCERLREDETKYCTEKAVLKEQQEKLRARVSLLRRTLAAAR